MKPGYFTSWGQLGKASIGAAGAIIVAWFLVSMIIVILEKAQ